MGKKAKRERAGSRRSPFEEMRIRPVSVELWLAAMKVWEGAATFATPVTNPQEFKFSIGGETYRFTDNPMNRGMVAIRELVNHDRALAAQLSARCMAFWRGLTTARAQPRFKEFFLTDSSDGSWNVSEALIEAFADASFAPNTLEIDIDSLFERVKHRLAEEEAKEASGSNVAPD